MELSTPVEQLSRVGPAYQKKLKRLGIKNVRDLLYHFPHRYEDFSNIVPISRLQLNEAACIQGAITEIKNIRTWKKRMFLTQGIIQDKSGILKIIWFNQPYLTKTLKVGDSICLAGKLIKKEKDFYFSNPIYEKLSADLTHTGRIVPMYPETAGLSSRWLRFIIKPILTNLKNSITDPLPPEFLKKFSLIPLSQALWQVHFPDSKGLAKKAEDRFSFEELFFISLFVQKERQKIKAQKAIALPIQLELIKDFVKRLPWPLTNAQKKTGWQILKDLEKPRPMNRLLEGDVGSGKTVVATMAALNTVKTGYQTAFMAPTEILAKQHFKTVFELLKDFNVSIGLVTGKDNRLFSKDLKEIVISTRKKLLEKIKSGELDILIGTHALIQKEIKFDNLALVILDEQHRFGVQQRAHLCQQKKFIPHLLSMTATPIPRTLTLTIFGDLDLSIINELPQGRKKIFTQIVGPEKRTMAYQFIKEQVKLGYQIFVICPRIEASARLTSWAEVKAVKEEYQKLSEVVFPDLKIAMLHGKMKSSEKEAVMNNFKRGEINILVSTSVVEVGVDIPNATVMMIEDAERFGLAQLHQFRGRVGRSKHQSYCLLFTDSPVSKTSQRLKAVVSSEDGFKLAEKDLAIRGPGSLDGIRQWGIPDLTMASLTDVLLVEKTQEAAKEMIKSDPSFKKHPSLKEGLKNFGERIHLE